MSDMKVIVSEVNAKRGLVNERYFIQIDAVDKQSPLGKAVVEQSPQGGGETPITEVTADALPKHVRDALYLWLASVEVTAA
ncbi:hypothetical protein CH273_25570 [Rhodococcus sp. 05-339-2]|uniref:hypothetical protein n=1 Tax=Rhodococcoides fascians TaxID=1828 RepID=UPI00050C8EFF|nr:MULTISPECIES: hypothetical protein [Rhodococcus]OZD74862.1 hypothetical protein CH273_25570 [Rhodococcus sp. 05-339-2]